jgi:tetratricopeptide (TPR) repeat protein
MECRLDYLARKSLKNKLSFIAGITILMSAVSILFPGCSTDRSIAIRYNGEKLLEKAEKLFNTAGIKPNLSDRATWDRIKNAYREVTGYCWKNIDSIPLGTHAKEHKELETVAFMAANRLSSIYYSERKYDSSILVLNQLLTFTHLEGRPLLTTRLNLARLLQSKGDWMEAMRIYQSVIDTFYPPVDNKNEIYAPVLNLPLEMVNVNRMLGDTAAAGIHAQSAMAYYQRLMREWPNSALATAARSNLARLYTDLGDWDKAIENLNQMKDSTGQTDIQAALMAANITASGKRDYRRAIPMYDNLINQTTDTSLLPAIYARKGIAYFESKDYNNCLATMRLIKDRYSRFFQSNPVPENYIALSLAQQGNWPLAESELQWLFDNYATSEEAFNGYLVISDHYMQSGDTARGNGWFRRGEEFYDRMIRQYSGSAIEASAISYKAEIARRQGNWDQAAKYLVEIFEKFPQSDIGRQGLLNAATVYREKLNNPVKADSLINRLKKELLPLEDGKNIKSMTDDNQ